MPDSPSGIPQVQDKRPKIAGLLPKNAQTRVLAGVSLLMILVMMFSGRKPTRQGGDRSVAVPQSGHRSQCRAHSGVPHAHRGADAPTRPGRSAIVADQAGARGSAPAPAPTGADVTQASRSALSRPSAVRSATGAKLD